jgi:hypothetical protein
MSRGNKTGGGGGVGGIDPLDAALENIGQSTKLSAAAKDAMDEFSAMTRQRMQEGHKVQMTQCKMM